MQNTMRQSLVKKETQPYVAESVTTNPEPGMRQKVKGLLHFKLKGGWRVAEVVALVDTGQTLPYDAIMSRTAWETLQQPELEPQPGTVGTASEAGVLTKRGVMGKQVNMSILLGNKKVEFRPLVLNE